MAVTERKTKEERREAVLDAAVEVFAQYGFSGASTEEIGTKKELFKAVIGRCFRETLDTFQRAAEGKRGQEALDAMGESYTGRLLPDRVRLRAQMQAYAACDDPEICEVVRHGYGDLVAYVERVSGLPPADVSRFFATGMLLNVIASMSLGSMDEPWAARLLQGCKD